MSLEVRKARLMPDGMPRYVRCYDNGGSSFDRYTVVYTGRYSRGPRRSCFYVGMSNYPFNAQGFGQHGHAPDMIDRPSSKHLGKRITFASLPDDCRKLVISDYIALWRLQ